MKKITLLLAGIVCSLSSQAQSITVVDKTTQRTIPGVVVYSNNPKASTLTNAKGKTDVSAFKSADSIFFRLVGYERAVYSYKQLVSLKFKVEIAEINISLGEIIVSANRREENKLETPNRVEKLDMKEVIFQNPQTTADLLGTSGYAYIQKSQLGGGSPMLRGMATNRVLLVVDGVRMNNAVFRAGNLQNVISLDANALESTEIFFGPGAVIYGSDAIGGVMHFHTLEPQFSDSAKKLLSFGSAMMRTSTANSEKTAHVDVNVGFNKLAFVTSFTRAEYGDLRSGSVGGVNYFYRPYYVETVNNKDNMVPNIDSTLQVGSKYSQTNFMQKVLYKPNSSW